jgi:cholesterol transport system auxiliary component
VSGAAGLRAGAAFATAAALYGCASLFGGGDASPTYFVWQDPGKSAPAATAGPRTLLVAPTGTATFYDTQRIAFAPDAGTRAYYQLAAWTERPGKRFDVLLVERLLARNAFAGIAATTSGTRGDLVLSASILDIYHDNSRQPGVARLRIAVELADRGGRALLARRTFEQEQPLAAESATAAVAAFDAAVARMLDELVPWLEREAAKGRAS